jgi:stress response protein YsnF
MRTVIGLFEQHDEALKAYTQLANDGIALADLDILTADDKDDEPKLAYLGTIVPEPDIHVYLAGVRQGGTLITANVADSMATRVAEIMSGFSMVNINQRAEELRSTDSSLTLSNPAVDENVIEVIEEELQVGKAEQERGRMRIYNVVTEREVSENVGLRDETIRVQRRAVNRTVAINSDLFKERSFEMVEVDEVATVGKIARVVEEIVLSKDVAEKIETIKETLRRQDVEIEEVPAVRAFEDYEPEFRSYYEANLAGKGFSYDQMAPALRFGYKLAVTEPFRSNPWTAVEADAHRLWEERNPGTWEQAKGAVRLAWEKVRSVR